MVRGEERFANVVRSSEGGFAPVVRGSEGFAPVVRGSEGFPPVVRGGEGYYSEYNQHYYQAYYFSHRQDLAYGKSGQDWAGQ